MSTPVGSKTNGRSGEVFKFVDELDAELEELKSGKRTEMLKNID